MAAFAAPAAFMRQPTLEQRAAAMYLPASRALVKQGARGKGKSKGSKFVSKVYNPQATRPQATLSTPYQEYSTTMVLSALSFTTSTSAATYVAISFKLSDFAASTEYRSLFDEYRFDFCEGWLEPSIVMSPSAGSVSSCSAVDLDDANVPANFGDVAARQGCCLSETGTGHYHKWKPCVAVALWNGAFTSFGSEPAPWIDCASPDVIHFGLKFATVAADGLARSMYLTVRAKMSFRGPAI